MSDTPSRLRGFPWGVPNPFYLLSATAFIHATTWPGGAAGTAAFGTGTQVALAAAYIAVSALTCVWLVRSLGRWDDARSLAVIVTGMFGVVSLELDAWLPTVSRGVRVAACLGLLAAAVGTLEFLRRGCGVRTSRRFLVAAYAQWALLCLIPAFMSERVETARLQIVGFAVVSAAAWLLYLPAVGRSRGRHDPRCGWRYPYCPWTLAVVTGGLTLARVVFLAVSFDAVPEVIYAGRWEWSTVLGFDLLVPFAASLSVLLAASGLRSRTAWVQRLAVGIAAGSPLLLLLPQSAVAAEFRAGYDWVHADAALAGLGLLTVAAMAARGVSGAAAGVAAAGVLFGAAVRGEGAAVAAAGQWVWGAAAAAVLIAAWRSRSAWRWGAAAAALFALSAEAVPAAWRADPWNAHLVVGFALFGVGAMRVRGDAAHALAIAATALWSLVYVEAAKAYRFEPPDAAEWAFLAGLFLPMVPLAWRFRDNAVVVLPALTVGTLGSFLLGRGAVRWVLRTRYAVRVLTLAAAGGLYAAGVVMSRAKTRAERAVAAE